MYCDCRNSRGKLILSQANLGRGKMQSTETCEKGLCIYCGHYAKYSNELTLTETVDIDKSMWITDKTRRSYRLTDGNIMNHEYMARKGFVSHKPLNKRVHHGTEKN